MSYAAFLEHKTKRAESVGVEPRNISEELYDFQCDLVAWAVRKGRAAIFADCGLGKTLMQLEWARHFAGRVLIVAPLGVADQTIHEAQTKLGLVVRRVHDPAECAGDGLWITNYERLARFVGTPLDAIVLDESSILKSVDGKTRGMLLREFAGVPRRLCCTATPAPNDVTELANHAEFLGAMTRAEMLATFFVHDAADLRGESGWRLKGHAAEAMYDWMASWAAYLSKPSDLGYRDDGFALPALTIRDLRVDSGIVDEGALFPSMLGGIGERSKVRRATMAPRVAATAELVAGSDQWLVWCGLNDEGRALKAALGDEAALIEGADSEEEKIARERAWRAGAVRVLITKPKIFGFGMNWQHCHRMAFLGLGDSYEQYYQAVRRCWRFGQTEPVEAVIVLSDAEEQIAENVRRKEADASRTAQAMIALMRESEIEEVRGVKRHDDYEPETETGQGWRAMLGDCVERIAEVETGSVGLSVFSPPFASLYTYSNSPRDMGNCKDYDEFFTHFGHLIPELLRVTMPGRRAACHVQQVTTTKATNGVIGWRDFRADTVRAFVAAGWVYDGEVVIDKDPQAQAIRTKSKQLLFVQKERDSSWLRPAMADYILLFRHPGENPVPLVADCTNEEWILWARPIWYGIRESNVLSYRDAREQDDEKHICPLQLETIQRCVRLWSARGETVFSPFAGIGSEGYVALQEGRQFTGIELKRSYFDQMTRNLAGATAQMALFEAAPTPTEGA